MVEMHCRDCGVQTLYQVTCGTEVFPCCLRCLDLHSELCRGSHGIEKCVPTHDPPDTTKPKCCICAQRSASHLCTCTFPLPTLCPYHLETHQLIPSRVHDLISIEKLGQFTSAHDVDQFNARKRRIQNAVDGARRGLDELTKCRVMTFQHFARENMEKRAKDEAILDEIMKIEKALDQELTKTEKELKDNETNGAYRPNGDLANAIWTYDSETADSQFQLVRYETSSEGRTVLMTKIDREGRYHPHFLPVQTHQSPEIGHLPEEISLERQLTLRHEQDQECLLNAATEVYVLFHSNMNSYVTARQFGRGMVENEAKERLQQHCEGLNPRTVGRLQRMMTIIVGELYEDFQLKQACAENQQALENQITRLRRRLRSHRNESGIEVESERLDYEGSPRRRRRLPSDHSSPDLGLKAEDEPEDEDDPPLFSLNPLIDGDDNVVTIFDCDREEKTIVRLDLKATNWATAVFAIAKGTYLLTYFPTLISKTNIYPPRSSLTILLRQGKLMPGLIADESWLYVFGGERCKTGHKFDLRTLSEEPIAAMWEERSRFQPCFHQLQVYLCGGGVRSSEVYLPEEDRMIRLPFLIPGNTVAYANVTGGTLVIAGESQAGTFAGKWEIGPSEQVKMYGSLTLRSWGRGVRIHGEKVFFISEEEVYVGETITFRRWDRHPNN